GAGLGRKQAGRTPPVLARDDERGIARSARAPGELARPAPSATPFRSAEWRTVTMRCRGGLVRRTDQRFGAETHALVGNNKTRAARSPDRFCGLTTPSLFVGAGWRRLRPRVHTDIKSFALR